MEKQELIAFEEEVKERYLRGEIKYPIHLRSGCEDQLIEIFNKFDQTKSFCLASWASHLHCLLHLVPREKVMEKILQGLSISMCFPEYRFFASGIVGNLVSTAVGLGMALKRKGDKETCVQLHIGDMAARLGSVNTAINYCRNFDLNVWFIIENNHRSVCTNTDEVWGSKEIKIDWDYPRIIHFEFEDKKYPHSGVGQKVAF